VPSPSTPSPRHDRLEIAFLLGELNQAVANGQSERDFFRSAPIARSTLRDEVDRVEAIEADPVAVAFFTSPTGQAMVMRWVLAAHVALTLLGPCGVPLVCTFLVLAGLGPFVGTSYGAQQKINAWLLQQVAVFGAEEEKRLGAAMPTKRIWLCEDETFFAAMILVAIEALSDYVLVARYAERRDAAAWNAAVQERIEGLPVEVAGVAADGAAGIGAHSRQSFGVEVTPDVFHVEHAAGHVPQGHLARRVEGLDKELREMQAIGGGETKEAHDLAEQLDEAREHQQRVTAALCGMSEADRPYDERTGEIRRGEIVEAELNEMLDEIEAVADEAALSEGAYKGLGKARRAIEAMGHSIESYHRRIELNLKTLQVPEEIAEAMRTQVLPALYLQKIAGQSRDAETKTRREQRARELVTPLQEQEDSPMRRLSQAGVEYLLEQGRQWVELFERSSSRVEGYNGHLELHHHSHRGLSKRLLAALPVVRNFWVRREDGRTAAEKFFEQKPRDLFEWLLDAMPDLPRPTQKRPRIAPSPLLN
jgi:hypothetical protein